MSGILQTLSDVLGEVSGSSDESVRLSFLFNNRPSFNGCDLRPSNVVNRPRVEVGGEDLRVFYTLVIVLIFFSNCFIYFSYGFELFD